MSLDYFSSRVSKYMDLDTDLPSPPEAVLDPNFVDLNDCDRLQRRHQDYFLDLFWAVYHYSSPIIDEQDFRAIYGSLWDSSDSKREAHPLVDIVLALTIQYAYSFMPRDDTTPGFIQEQGSIAGSPFYHRSQAAVNRTLESPSLMTVQCMYFSAIYLSFARCTNASYTILKAAEQVANVLGRQEDPKSQCLLVQTKICIRLIDVKLSIKLGRPMPVQPMSPNCEFQAEGQPEWLLYQEQILRLSESVRDVYINFMDHCSQLLDARNEDDIYVSSKTRDDTAAFMRQQMRKLDEWTAQVPPALRLPRHGSCEAFSTQRPHLDLQENVPQWLQRQRVALECHYHDLCTSLFRVFIAFSPTPERGTINADGNCISSVNHAVAMTCIISQVMRDTDILTGCYQAFDWQHSAAFTLAGFAAGYPVCAPTPTARKALAAAREVFATPCAGGLATGRMEALSVLFDNKIAEIISNFKQGLGMSTAASSKTSTGETSSSSATVSGATPVDPNLDEAKQTAPLDPLWDINMDTSELWEWDQMAPMDEDLWSRLLGDFEGDKLTHQ